MAKQAKSRPRTGQRRQRRDVLSIDLLPMEVHEAIKKLRSRFGLSWVEIERLSSLPYNAEWFKAVGKHGFVNWDEVSTKALNRFPELRLPQTNLRRWYDLRVEQAQKEVMARAEQARVIAEAFAQAGIDKADEAVVNAARDVIFELLQAADTKSRVQASAGLIALAEVMNGARANDIKKRKVAVEERRIAQFEKDAALKRKRLEQETESAAKKLSKGEFTLEDINRLRERTFGLPPVQSAKG